MSDRGRKRSKVTGRGWNLLLLIIAKDSLPSSSDTELNGIIFLMLFLFENKKHQDIYLESLVGELNGLINTEFNKRSFIKGSGKKN